MFSRTAPTLLRLTTRPSLRIHPTTRPIRPATALRRSSRPRFITSTSLRAKGLQPDSEDPLPPHSQSTSTAGAASHVTEPTPLSPEEYYEFSEHYFNVLLGELEKAQEEGSDVEAEYSVCPFEDSGMQDDHLPNPQPPAQLTSL